MKKDEQRKKKTFDAAGFVCNAAEFCKENIKLIVSILCITVFIIWWIENDEPATPSCPLQVPAEPAATVFQQQSVVESSGSLPMTVLKDADPELSVPAADQSVQPSPDGVEPPEAHVQVETVAVAAIIPPDVPHYNRAVELVTQGKYDTAIKAFEQAIQHDEYPLDSHYRLGNLYRFIIGDEEKAAYHLSQYLELIKELDQENAAADQSLFEQSEQQREALELFQQGVLKAGQDDLQGALADLEKAVRLYPEEPLIHYNLATLYHKAERLPEATAAYRASIARDIKNAAAYFGLGMAYQQLNNPVDAITAYKHALEIDPRHLGSMNNLAVIYERVGMAEQAAEWYNQIIQVDPQYARAYNNLGTIFARQGQFEQADEQFLKAVQADPSYLEPHYNRARLFEQAGKPAEALEEYRFIYLRDNSFADAGEQIERLEKAQAAVQPEPVSEQKKPSAVSPNQSEQDNAGQPVAAVEPAVHEETAVPPAQRGESPAEPAVPNLAEEPHSEIFDVALEDLKSRVNANPDSPEPYIALAEYAIESDYLDIAHEYIEQGLTEFPENLELHFLLGKTLAGKRFYYRAISEYKLITELHPDAAEAYYYLSLLYIEKANPLRDTRTALQYYRTYNELGGRKPLSFSDSARTVFFDTNRENQLLDPSSEPASFPEYQNDKEEW